MKVRQGHLVCIDQADRPDSRGGQIHRRCRTQPAGPDEQDPGGLELPLSRFPNQRQYGLPGVPNFFFRRKIRIHLGFLCQHVQGFKDPQFYCTMFGEKVLT